VRRRSRWTVTFNRERDGSDGVELQSRPDRRNRGECDECHGKRDDVDGDGQSGTTTGNARTGDGERDRDGGSGVGRRSSNVPFTTGQTYSIAPKVVSITRADRQSGGRGDSQLHGDLQ
jgi:hypothetical protein